MPCLHCSASCLFLFITPLDAPCPAFAHQPPCCVSRRSSVALSTQPCYHLSISRPITCRPAWEMTHDCHTILRTFWKPLPGINVSRRACPLHSSRLGPAHRSVSNQPCSATGTSPLLRPPPRGLPVHAIVVGSHPPVASPVSSPWSTSETLQMRLPE